MNLEKAIRKKINPLIAELVMKRIDGDPEVELREVNISMDTKPGGVMSTEIQGDMVINGEAFEKIIDRRIALFLNEILEETDDKEKK